MNRHLLFLAALGLLPGSLFAGLQLAPLFRDHGVVQCDAPVAVWGRADPGDEVTVGYLGQTATVQAEADGRWHTVVGPFGPGRTGDFTVQTPRASVTRHDVITGDVWLCAGQSNLQMHVRDANGAPEAIATGDLPDIREFKVAIQTAAAPAETVDGQWTAASPKTLGNFSAVAFYFARAIHARIGRPVGVIVVAKGGTPIESWLSPELLRNEPDAPALLDRWEKILSHAPVSLPQPARPPFEPVEFSMSLLGPGGYAQPGVIYNGMLAPLVPYAVRGVLWYQGETNTPKQFLQPAEYGPWFRRVITDLRMRWRQELPVYFVQLPANNLPERDFTGGQWATLRAAQASALALPRTGMAVTIDLGPPDEIHPPVKRPVGERLARLALKRTYGLPEIVDSGPEFRGVKREGDILRLDFLTAGKLATRDGLPPAGFEFIAADGRRLPAALAFEGATVVARLAAAAEVRVIRYGWVQNPASANLCGADGLPVAPFRIALMPGRASTEYVGENAADAAP